MLDYISRHCASVLIKASSRKHFDRGIDRRDDRSGDSIGENRRDHPGVAEHRQQLLEGPAFQQKAWPTVNQAVAPLPTPLAEPPPARKPFLATKLVNC